MIYLAGAAGLKSREENWQRIGRRRLLSFWNLKNEEFAVPHAFNLIKEKHMKRTSNKVDLFLDSGAFSAWSQGKEIDIEEYIECIKKHEKYIEVYANLDVIAEKGKRPNRKSAEQTLKNQHQMEQAGLSPLPVFHMGEPTEFLDNYIEKYDYIGIGGLAKGSTSLDKFLNRIFQNHICDEKGMPKVKVHGFAVTSLKRMLRYPWYSVDSTSWVLTGRMGSIFVPNIRNGEWLYDEQSWKVAVSNRNPGMKDDFNHVNNMTPKIKELFLNYIHHKGYKLGKSEFKMVDQDYSPDENEQWFEKKPEDKNTKRKLEIVKEEGITNTYQLRDEMNIIYFRDLEDALPEWPWAFKPNSETIQKTLF